MEFVDQLTNWYIRLNRRRFWGGNSPEEREDKRQAYATLHHALLSFVRVLAPLAPFVSEEIYQNLNRGKAALPFDSIHLAPFPRAEHFKGAEIDTELERTMELFQEVILLARALRNEHGLKIRQPLQELTIVYQHESELNNLKILDSYIKEELNVKNVCYTPAEEKFVSLEARLNTKKLGKTLGPKLGKEKMKLLNGKVRSLTTEEIRSIEAGKPFEFEDITLGQSDFLVSRKAKQGITAAASSGQITVVLDTVLTQELRLEGFSRDFVNRVQKIRKDYNYEVTDRIVIKYMTASNKLSLALSDHKTYIVRETLAVEMEEVTSEEEMGLTGSQLQLPVIQEIDGDTIIIALTRIQG